MTAMTTSPTEHGPTPRRRRATLLGTTVLLAALAAPLSGAAEANAPGAAWCRGEGATMVGTNRPDDLVGTAGRDVVVARGGDDVIETKGGNDLVCAGDDFDLVLLGAGRDRAYGGAGDDTLTGQGGADVLFGETQVDALAGGAGDDRLVGGRGTSIVVEALNGGPGDDRLFGGAGNDSAQYFDAREGVRVDLAAGTASGHGNDLLASIEGVTGSRHADVIIGNDAGNGLFGQEGNDVIRGGPSGFLDDGDADVVSGGQGADQLVGGPGEDMVTYAWAARPVLVDLRAGEATGSGPDSLTGFEVVQGSSWDDRLLGSSRPDLLVGHLGDDTLDGRGGLDTAVFADLFGPVRVMLDPALVGPPSTAVTLHGTAEGEAVGRDTLHSLENVWGTNQADEIYGDDGANQLFGRGGADLLVGFGGVDLLDGGSGVDNCADEPDQLHECESGAVEAGPVEAGGVEAGGLGPWVGR